MNDKQLAELAVFLPIFAILAYLWVGFFFDPALRGEAEPPVPALAVTIPLVTP